MEVAYIAFRGNECVAEGSLSEVLPILKAVFDRDPGELVLVFEVESGRQVDFDLGGTLGEALARVELPARGRGRPRLGVTSREISMLPRHWEWLERQPGGASGALRRLVDQASKVAPGLEKARDIQNGLGAFLTAMAGNLAHYEEACRALYAGRMTDFSEQVRAWPPDIRSYVNRRAAEFEACRQHATG